MAHVKVAGQDSHHCGILVTWHRHKSAHTAVCVCICVAEYFSQLEIAYAILYVERFTKPLWSLFDPRALFVFTSYAFNVWGKMVERQVCSWNELNEVHFKPAKLTFTGVLHVVQKTNSCHGSCNVNDVGRTADTHIYQHTLFELCR